MPVGVEVLSGTINPGLKALNSFGCVTAFSVVVASEEEVVVHFGASLSVFCWEGGEAFIEIVSASK